MFSGDSPQPDVSDLSPDGRKLIKGPFGAWHVKIFTYDKDAGNRIQKQINFLTKKMNLYRNVMNTMSATKQNYTVDELELSVYFGLLSAAGPNNEFQAYRGMAIPPKNPPPGLTSLQPYKPGDDDVTSNNPDETNMHSRWTGVTSDGANMTYYVRNKGERDAEVDANCNATIPDVDATDVNEEILQRAYYIRITSLRASLKNLPAGKSWDNPSVRSEATQKALDLEIRFLRAAKALVTGN
jgi:hypothetical protein